MSFWYNLLTPKYVRLLEKENAELKAKIERLECILIPRLAIPVRMEPNGAQRPFAKSPGLGKDEQLLGGVPGLIQGGDQSERTTQTPVRLKRPSWPEAKARAEYLSDAELREAERLEKTRKHYQ